jgi:thiamine pyrophosphokinase
LSKPTRAVIFANGEMENRAAVKALIHPSDTIIAADGGAQYCQQLGLSPDVLIGDFDSLSSELLAGFEQAGAQIIRHPARKDFTDLELALQYARSLGAIDILVLGALGARWDQSLANLLLAASEQFKDINIKLIDGEQEIFLLREGSTHEVTGEPGDIVSLIPLGDSAQGIRTEGLEYPLQDEPLIFGATRGISNVLLDRTALISLNQGSLLCVIIHNMEHKENRDHDQS